jgi:hypothetical protein
MFPRVGTAVLRSPLDTDIREILNTYSMDACLCGVVCIERDLSMIEGQKVLAFNLRSKYCFDSSRATVQILGQGYR